MKKLLRKLLIFTCALALLGTTACNDSHEEEIKKDTQTLIFYFAGTHLTLYFHQNISSIKDALRKDIKGDSRVILFFQQGEKKSAEIIELLYENGLCEEKKLNTYDLPERMDAENLSFYLKEIMRYAPADRYSLIIGSHGTGWIPMDGNSGSISQISSTSHTPTHQDYWERTGEMMTRFIGDDANRQNAFDIPTLAEALTMAGKKMEYILFDACFMANVESLYDLRHNAKYIIGSVCEIMGSGFPYATVLPHMLTNYGTGYNLQGICETFNKYYNDNYGYSGSISIIDCAQLDALATAMKQINQGQTKEYNLAEIQTYEGQVNHIFFDLGDYVDKMCDNASLKANFNRQLSKSVINKYTLDKFYSAYGISGKYSINKTAYSGLSTSAPAKVYVSDYKQTAWYKATH